MARARGAVSKKQSSAVDQQLSRYRSMRDFDVTQEPSGDKVRAAKAAELPFVIQKHAATRLHYDFRLGWNGVLKSWAVTKGPSYFPGDKRLAVQVEDHPMEYGGFEGIIPKGQYGGGTVMLWDRGTWEPHVDVDEGLRKGSLKFALHGEKMRGNWALVRMHPRPGEREGKPNWLLIKEHDKFERSEDDKPVTEAKTKSVLSKRDMDAITRDEDRVWQSSEVQKTTDSARKKVRGMVAKSEEAPATKRASKSVASDLPVRLTHPDKVVDPTSGVTKEQLARYYLEVSDAMLPHVADRPLTLVRCVDGSGKPCFYQKHSKETMPGLDSVDVPNRKTGATEPYITLNTREALVQLAQIGVLEVHPWGSRNETMEQPDRIIIDLDPDAAIDWPTIVASAKEVRKRMQKLGLKTFVKSTGGKGLHVVAPIRPEHEWPEVKKFTHEFVLALEKDFPERFLTKMTKAARVGKIFLDYLRNDRGATAVAPYSPRARAGLPVAVPLSWSELDEKEPPRFRVADIQSWRKRLARDPWKEMPGLDQRLKLA